MDLWRSGRRRLAIGVSLAYGMLLAVSGLVRATRHPATWLTESASAIEVRAVSADRLLSTPVRMAYWSLAGPTTPGAPTIVLLHGSPGRKEDFRRLAPMLARNARVIVPDLPGFGASTSTLPDYSSRAHALYVRQLLEDLGVGQVHVVGYSMGGGVALNLVDVAPARVSSLTMLSALGVQEMELTGDYYVNHLVHGAQLAAIWAAIEATPHMGLLDGGMLGLPYARNFFDSDQRPLRAVLQRVTVPTLILHGTDDDKVPIDAAREHWRLVPQSELLTIAGDHLLVFTQPATLADPIAAFVRRVEHGEARVRKTATPERQQASARAFDSQPLPPVRGIARNVLVGVLTTGALLTELPAAAAAGVLVARGRIGVMAAMVAGIIAGWLSQGVRPVRGRARANVTPALIASAGRAALLVAAASLIAFPLIPLATQAARPYLAFIVLVAAITGVLAIGMATLSWRRRRLLVSRWRRATRWEFWPPWLFYPPVLAYVCYLMVRHRSLTLFTAANPAILAGGFVGESKFEILRGLAGAGDAVARSTLITADLRTAEKVPAAGTFMAAERLTFPVVLKPDHGQRGSGVVVVRSAEALEICLQQSSVDTILQEYVAGAEFGVFYYRRPSEPTGHIFSITEKQFPSVVGDGRRTLEQLILGDERAVCAAPLYFQRHRDRLASVLDSGERVPLVELGTHCRGALFLDGGWAHTPALAARFDDIARRFQGFYFGRFDVRVDGGADAFLAGRGFKIIELNGVTSEATHIYHPGTPLMRAYGVLMTQWRIAFEIGAECRRLGTAPLPVRRLAELVSEYRRTARAHLDERQAHR